MIKTVNIKLIQINAYNQPTLWVRVFNFSEFVKQVDRSSTNESTMLSLPAQRVATSKYYKVMSFRTDSAKNPNEFQDVYIISTKISDRNFILGFQVNLTISDQFSISAQLIVAFFVR